MKTCLLSALLVSTAAAAVVPHSTRRSMSPNALGLKPIMRRQNQVIPVIVGGQQDVFIPNSVVAAVGDIVQFQFSNGNHTVTQSTADQACTPMEGGIHSGHIPFQDGQTEVGTFNMPVLSTEPIFLYCATGPHCQLGQVMVINPQSARQVADYTKLSTQTESSTDGTTVIGGTPGTLSLDTAAFIPAPPEDPAAAPPPPAEAPPAEAPPAEAPPAEAPPAEAPAETPAAEAPASEAPPAEAPAEGETAANVDVPAVLGNIL